MLVYFTSTKNSRRSRPSPWVMTKCHGYEEAWKMNTQHIKCSVSLKIILVKLICTYCSIKLRLHWNSWSNFQRTIRTFKNLMRIQIALFSPSLSRSVCVKPRQLPVRGHHQGKIRGMQVDLRGRVWKIPLSVFRFDHTQWSAGVNKWKFSDRALLVTLAVMREVICSRGVKWMTFTRLDPEAYLKGNSDIFIFEKVVLSRRILSHYSWCYFLFLCFRVLTFMPADLPALAFSVSVWYHSLMWLTHRLAYLKGGELMFMSSLWQGRETLGWWVF